MAAPQAQVWAASPGAEQLGATLRALACEQALQGWLAVPRLSTRQVRGGNTPRT